MTERNMDKAALRGEPSYVWREGQKRRLNMIQKFAGERMQGQVLENGCGVGMYMEKMTDLGANVTLTVAEPEGPSPLHPIARDAAALSAALAASGSIAWAITCGSCSTKRERGQT